MCNLFFFLAAFSSRVGTYLCLAPLSCHTPYPELLWSTKMHPKWTWQFVSDMEEESHSDCTVSLSVKSLWPPGECDHENPIRFVSTLSQGLPDCCLQPSLAVALGPETRVAPIFSCSILCWVVQYSVFCFFVTILGSHSSGHLNCGGPAFEPGDGMLLFSIAVGQASWELSWIGHISLAVHPVLSPSPVTCFTQGLSQETLNLIWLEISLAVCELG